MATLSRHQQIIAVDLYQNGFSMQKVANHLGVSLGVIVYTLRHNMIARRSITASNRIRFEAQPLSYTLKESLSPEEEQLKLAASMLYWAEGYKVGKAGLDFANSDPRMNLIFIRFLREICHVTESRIRCFIYSYEGQNISTLTTFWSTLLSVPKNQFTKPYIKQAAPGPQGPRMIHGLVHIRYCDKKLLQQVLRWIDEYAEKCVGGGVVNREWL